MKRKTAIFICTLCCMALAACGSKETGGNSTGEGAAQKQGSLEDVKDTESKEPESRETEKDAEEYVLAPDEQYRIIDTKDISMKEVCSGYELPFDLVLPVPDFPYEEKVYEDDTYGVSTSYTILDPYLKDWYSFTFHMTHKSGEPMAESMDFENGQLYRNAQEVVEDVKPRQILPNAYYQYNGMDNGEYTFAYGIELYGNKNFANGLFYIRNSSSAEESDEQFFYLNVSVHKEVGVDRSEYMLDYLDEIKTDIMNSMGLDPEVDKATMEEVGEEVLSMDLTGKPSASLTAPVEKTQEPQGTQYEEVIGDVDVDTSAISVSDLSELVAGLDFTVDDSIYDYDSLNLKELTILAPGSLYISSYTDSGIEAVFDAFDVTIKCQTTNVALEPFEDDTVLADTDGYTVYRMNTFTDNSDMRSYQRYMIYDKATGAGLNIHLEISKHDVAVADSFVDAYIPAFEKTLANNF